MKWIFSILIFFTSSFAYQQGDMIGQKVLKQLQLQGEKVYVLDFFASWCISCKKEIKELSKIDFTSINIPIEIIGIDVDEKIKDAQKFQNLLKKQGYLQYKVINDPRGNIVSRFNPVGFPALYIVKNGKIISSIIGAKNNIGEIIKSIIVKEVK